MRAAVRLSALRLVSQRTECRSTMLEYRLTASPRRASERRPHSLPHDEQLSFNSTVECSSFVRNPKFTSSLGPKRRGETHKGRVMFNAALVNNFGDGFRQDLERITQQPIPENWVESTASTPRRMRGSSLRPRLPKTTRHQSSKSGDRCRRVNVSIGPPSGR